MPEFDPSKPGVLYPDNKHYGICPNYPTMTSGNNLEFFDTHEQATLRATYLGTEENKASHIFKIIGKTVLDKIIKVEEVSDGSQA